MIEYAAKFLQLSGFGMYLILNEEKKAKKFERGLNSHIQIMMSYFDIWDFSQLVDRASIYEASLKGNAAEYAELYSNCNQVHWGPWRMEIGSCYQCC